MFIVKDIKISSQVELILTDIDGNSTVFLKPFKHFYIDELKLCIVMCNVFFNIQNLRNRALFSFFTCHGGSCSVLLSITVVMTSPLISSPSPAQLQVS